MKTIFAIFIISFFFTSCSTENCINTYLKAQQTNDDRNEKNIVAVLTDKKLAVSNTLDVYFGRKRGDWSTQAKIFKQEDHDFLSNLYRNDTITKYWSKKESNRFEFISLIKKGGLSKFRDSINSINENLVVYNYNLSKPIFTEDKKLALFSIVITRQPNTTLDNSVIIMKKEKGKWIFVEKVHSSSRQ